MKVLELNREKFVESCVRLLERVDDFANYDAIVGIKTGGSYVGNTMHRNRSLNCQNMKYFEVTCQRPSTKKKEKSLLKNILKMLPDRVLNYLRSMESWMVGLRLRKNNLQGREVLMGNDLRDFLASKNSSKLLLVDDAVDSGETIQAIKEKIRKLTSDKANVSVAVVVKTQKNPIYKPNYYLYENLLIRFPWAMDYKGADGFE